MYKALTSFTGLLSMAQGEIKEITDKSVIKDLIRAGYIEEVKDYTSLLDKISSNNDKKNKKNTTKVKDTEEEKNDKENTSDDDNTTPVKDTEVAE